jgi:hypothetical protein
MFNPWSSLVLDVVALQGRYKNNFRIARSDENEHFLGVHLRTLLNL